MKNKFNLAFFTNRIKKKSRTKIVAVLSIACLQCKHLAWIKTRDLTELYNKFHAMQSYKKSHIIICCFFTNSPAKHCMTHLIMEMTKQCQLTY